MEQISEEERTCLICLLNPVYRCFCCQLGFCSEHAVVRRLKQHFQDRQQGMHCPRCKNQTWKRLRNPFEVIGEFDVNGQFNDWEKHSLKEKHV